MMLILSERFSLFSATQTQWSWERGWPPSFRFFIQNLSDPFLLSTETTGISALLFRGLHLGHLAFSPVKLQNLANILRRRLAMFESTEVTNFFTPSLIKYQNLCWFNCLPSAGGQNRILTQPLANALLSSTSRDKAVVADYFKVNSSFL